MTPKHIKHKHHVKSAVAASRLNPVYTWIKAWWRRTVWNRILAIFGAILILFGAGSYSIALWYQNRHANEPLRIGTTFIPSYAEYYGLDPQQALDAILNDLGIRQLRLVSYWDEIEPAENNYDFSTLDWQFEMAEKAGAKISLAIGLRQPRWPECHMPTWAGEKPIEVWSSDLKDFMGDVIDRYRSSPALESYQLENEFFMKVFGICPDHSRERLVDEFNFVKQRDPDRPVIISRSNNWVGIPIYEPQADQYAVSVYKRVWDTTLTKRYFEYPLPPWFYSTLAGAEEIYSGKDMIIHELQMEPWLPAGFSMNSTDPRDIAEQNKSMNAKRLRDRLYYASDSGMRTIYTWGVEWWYWRMVAANDPSIWNAARETILELQTTR